MVGHKKIMEDLRTLAENGALGHGYIFHGPSMVGKRTAAAEFARFIEKDAGEVLQDLKIIDVEFMRSLNPDTSGDWIGIDAVREVKNFLWQKPNASLRRTLVIDNAELLTAEAQNALLKITEEPPASSLLILVASDIESILPTIVSRLPKIYFGAVTQKEIEDWLVKDLAMAKTKAAALAKKALGKPGIAWRLANDEAFQRNLDLAGQFLKTTAAGRRDFIKKLIEPDDFSFRLFLDALILTLAWEKPSKTKAQFWHKTMKLYEGVTSFSLNPRLQLEALMK